MMTCFLLKQSWISLSHTHIHTHTVAVSSYETRSKLVVHLHLHIMFVNISYIRSQSYHNVHVVLSLHYRTKEAGSSAWGREHRSLAGWQRGDESHLLTGEKSNVFAAMQGCRHDLTFFEWSTNAIVHPNESKSLMKD